MKLLMDTPVNLMETGYGGAWHNFAMCLIRRGIELLNRANGARPDISVYFGQPYREWKRWWKRRTDRHGIFTMFESPILPPHWVEDLNGNFDFVIVPSTWCKETFEKGGIEKPVFVVPLGVDPLCFPYLERPVRKTFTIIWQGLYLKDRKGFSLIEKALAELNLSKVRVIDKTVPFALKNRIKWEFSFPTSGDLSICRKMMQAELLMLLAEADLSINPTSGEGFGLIPLEHMAIGLPTLVSRNSGCLDYINPEYNIPIECTEQNSWFGAEYGKMMRPDLEDLKTKIQYAYDNRDEIREMGKKASEWVHKEWNYEKATDRFEEVLNAVIA